MRAYIAEQCESATADLTATTHGTTIQLVSSVADVGHELYMDD
jgi:hypothetical protein